MASLDENGLVIGTQPELEAALKAKIRQVLKDETGIDIDLDEGPEQQVIGDVADELAGQDEVLQALYGVFQGRGRGVNADWFAAITGTTRRAATRTRVPSCVVTLAAHKTLAAGKVAAIDGSPDDQFQLVADVSNDTDTQANVDAVFECLTTGPVPALAGKLTKIVTSSDGWIAIANTDDGLKGKDVADDVELNATRKAELAGLGADSYEAIRARVLKVPGVVSAEVYGNETSAIVAGRPAKSFEVVLWDLAGEANDDAIAQAIYDTKPAGMQAYGVSSGTALTKTLRDFTIGFTRATVLELRVAATVILSDDAGADWLAQAIAAVVARGEEYVVGQRAYAQPQISEQLDLPSIEGVITCFVDSSGLAVDAISARVVPTYAQIIRISSGNVSITVAS